MKRKVFFIVGLAVSAIAAGFFIPMQNGSWWSFNSDESEIIVYEVMDRTPAGESGQGDYFPAEGAEPQPPPANEPAPTYSGVDKGGGSYEPEPSYSGEKGGKDYVPTAPPEPYYPPPAPAPMSCIKKAFTPSPMNSDGGYTRSWVRGVNMSDAYINGFIASAQKQFGKTSLRAAITGLVSAGYCPRQNNYSVPLNLSATDMIPVVHGKGNRGNLDERAIAWKGNNKTRPYRCGNDSFKESRKKICSTIYRNCGISNWTQADCFMAEPTGGRENTERRGNRPDRGGGSNSGGSTSGGGSQREVGEGSNRESGHEADRGGSQGDGPPGTNR